MNHREIFCRSLTVALAVFLFGFDTVVISGADLSLQALWPHGEVVHGFMAMASALWGAVVGAMLGGIPTDKMGRKKSLFWIGIFYFVSAVGSAPAGDPWVFAFFCFLGGLGVGASTIAAPAYISEIAPANNRGKLVALYRFNIVFGILAARAERNHPKRIRTEKRIQRIMHRQEHRTSPSHQIGSEGRSNRVFPAQPRQQFRFSGYKGLNE